MGIFKAFIIARVLFTSWKHACTAVGYGVKCAPYIGAACAVGIGAMKAAPYVKPFLAEHFPGPRYACLPTSPLSTF